MGNCCRSKGEVSSEMKTIQLSDISQRNSEVINKEEGDNSSAASYNGALAIALFSLHSKNDTILNFEKGDKLVIENNNDPDWCLVRHVGNQLRGYAPKTYLELDTALANEEWFFGDTSREDAERLLSQPENETGAFLVRNSLTTGAYALSVKDHSVETNSTIVRHYKMKTVEGGGYFIRSNDIFPTLNALVNFYTGSENGLCQRLRNACRRPRPLAPGPLPDTKDEYEVPFKSLKFIRPLGRGQFGEVSYGIWNGIYDVAIKQLATNGMESEEFCREVAVMKAINHSKIVRLFAICTEREPFCIIMEYLCNGNLEHYLKTEHGKQLRLPSLVNMSAQISEGMKYLESKSLIHRDLAARNILVGDGGIVKLADFGLARILDDAIYVGKKDGKLPIKWTAPEACSSRHFTIKSDVWSFGITLYEIFTHGEMPYKGMKNSEVTTLISQYNYRMPKPKDPECSDAVYGIMLMCWKSKPEERPTFEYLHHFFTDYYVTSEASYKETFQNG